MVIKVLIPVHNINVFYCALDLEPSTDACRCYKIVSVTARVVVCIALLWMFAMIFVQLLTILLTVTEPFVLSFFLLVMVFH